MTFQEEQEAFKQEIEKNFISLFDLTESIAKEKKLSIKDAGLYLSTRINNYLYSNVSKPFAFELVTPPFIKYSLNSVDIEEVKERLAFLSRNGRFKSDKKAKKIGLLISVVEQILNPLEFKNDDAVNEQIAIKYDQTERITHLQTIAILAEELAKLKGGRYLKKSTNLPNHLHISELLERLSKEIEVETLKARSAGTYRKRLAEASKYYKGL